MMEISGESILPNKKSLMGGFSLLHLDIAVFEFNI